MNKREIQTLVSDVYASLPPVWVAKDGNLAFNEYVQDIQEIQLAREKYLGGGGERFLDIGMSMGVVACAMSKLGLSVDGCDYLGNRDHPILAPIREQFGVGYADYDASVDDLPYEDESFDVVNSNAMIEHLHTSPKKMLLEVLRVLKPGGAFIISNPNIAALHNRIQLLFGGSVHASIRDWYHNPAWARPKYTGHVREYSPSELRYVLEQAGFRNVRATSRSPLPGSKRPERPSDASLDYTGRFTYLKNSPFHTREFRVRSLYDVAVLANQIATFPLPGARRVAVARGQK